MKSVFELLTLSRALELTLAVVLTHIQTVARRTAQSIRKRVDIQPYQE